MAATTVPKIQPVTDVQFAALLRLIGRSNDGTEPVKQLLIWLLRQTENLSQPCSVTVKRDVEITIPVDGASTTDAFASHLHDVLHEMVSSGRSTNLNELFLLAGSPMVITRSWGSDGLSIWCTPAFYGKDFEVVKCPLDLDAILAVNLRRL